MKRLSILFAVGSVLLPVLAFAASGKVTIQMALLLPGRRYMC